MRRSVILVFCCHLLILGILIRAQQQQPDIERRYHQALGWYNDPNPTAEKDSLAQVAFQEIISLTASSPLYDSIRWDALIKLGVFRQTYGTNEEAIPFYRKAMALKARLTQVKEQDWFLPQLYLGNCYYSVNRFDSAAYYYNQAGQLADRFPAIPGIERLYNALGLLNFESGNYRQSRNHFEKALSVLQQHPKPELGLVVNFKNNLANALDKLSEYDSAMKIYQEILPSGVYRDAILQNIASIYLKLGASKQALASLSQINEPGISVYNNFGLAYFNAGNPDSAIFYFRKALQLNQEQNLQTRNINAGISYRYLGDLYAQEQKNAAALQSYQSALQQFIYTFNAQDPAVNPQEFTSAFAVNEIYETLLAKAQVYRKFYDSRKDTNDLKHALDAFHSLYRLTSYVEKTYASDEARIYLNQRKHLSHHLPINTALQLYYTTGGAQYLEEVFYFDEQNKASVLNNGLLEGELKKALQLPDSLVAGEQNCKALINRLNLQASATKDVAQLENIRQRIREQELLLEKLNREMEQIPEYARKKFTNRSVTLSELEEKIIPEGSAVLSYHVGTDSLLCWVIRKDGHSFTVLPKTDSLIMVLNSLTGLLHQPATGNSTRIREFCSYLYNKLVQPVAEQLSQSHNLMIIPDDELNYLPFEMLRVPSGQYFFEEYAITYNYSCNLLRTPEPTSGISPQQILAMAPFAKGSPSPEFTVLPASSKEVDAKGGQSIKDAAASKERFLSEAGSYRMLHLATHASANDADPLKSFIAFYPSHTDSPELDRIYLPEIYSLKLNQTAVAFLSACETGGGQLIRGEGVISLSRAFAYAGCPNMIYSQWKADDASTAYLAIKLREQLAEGKGVAQSLQLARKAYLADASIATNKKDPYYWAQLRFTGQFQQEPASPLKYIVWGALLFAGMLLMYYIWKRK